MQTKPRSGQRQQPTPTLLDPQYLELRVVITNGNTANDAKLKFEFSRDLMGTARLWLVKLPRLKNADAFPQPLASGIWELRLNAVSATQPLQVHSYSPDSARQWLADVIDQPKPAPTELLILCHHGQFTITIHQSTIA